MKKLLTLIMLLVSVFTVVAVANTKDAVAANTDNSKEKWYAIGTINGTSWNTDFELKYSADTDRYELEIALTAGNEFKIRKDKAWTTSIGYGGNTGAGISTYLSNSGGNFKVKTTGNYVLWVKDDNVRNYGDKSYGFGIDKAAEVVYRTVTHYAKDGKELKSEQVIDKSAYNPAFAEVEGYRLEGWYKDQALTQKINKGDAVTSDLKLYPKYVEAEDYVIYFKDASNVLGNAPSVYMWADALDGSNNAVWPGVALENAGSRGWKITVDASKSFDSIIFNNGASSNTIKTDDLDLTLANNGDTFVLGAKGTETYAASVEHTGVVYGLQDLISEYYNNGTYVRNTHINIDDVAKKEMSIYFHNAGSDKDQWANLQVNRQTNFCGNYLYFNEGNKTGFGTSANGTLTSFTWNGSYDNSTSVGNAIDPYFVTLKDFVDLENNSSNAGASGVDLSQGWTYANSVYTCTNKAVIEAAKAFTAPGWIDAGNYTDFEQVTITVTDAGLVIALHVHSTNVGILKNPSTTVFSSATIS